MIFSRDLSFNEIDYPFCRSGGGSFGKMEQAHEDQYFRKQQHNLLDKLKREQQGELKKEKEGNDKNGK